MSNNSGRAKVNIVKNERDPPLFTADKILKDSKKHYSGCHTHRVKILFSVISSPITLERQKQNHQKPEALKSLYRSPGNKKKQLVLCKNYVLQW